jgi:high mobility group protein B1
MSAELTNADNTSTEMNYDDVDNEMDNSVSVDSSSDEETEEFDINENTVLVKPDLLGVKRSKIINKAINDYVVQFLSTVIINSSTDNNSIISEWNTKDNQHQLNGYIHQNKIKMKKKVDLNEPKKWDNEFTYFSREMRQKIKTENPDADADIIPTIAKEWQEVKKDPVRLQVYIDMAVADKKRYDDELNRHKMIKQREENKAKLEKRLTKMKERNDKKIAKAQGRPKSAYYFFIQDEKPKVIAENTGFDKKQVHNELQKRWKDLKTTDENLYNSYKKIADEKAKEMPPPPPPVEKKHKKYETPRDKKINEAKVSKYDKNKERNKLREEEKKTPPTLKLNYNAPNYYPVTNTYKDPWTGRWNCGDCNGFHITDKTKGCSLLY